MLCLICFDLNRFIEWDGYAQEVMFYLYSCGINLICDDFTTKCVIDGIIEKTVESNIVIEKELDRGKIILRNYGVNENNGGRVRYSLSWIQGTYSHAFSAVFHETIDLEEYQRTVEEISCVDRFHHLRKQFNNAKWAEYRVASNGGEKPEWYGKCRFV